MQDVQFTLHVVNALMFAVSLYIHTRGYFEAKGCIATVIIQRLGRNLMLAGAALSALFLYLQYDWIMSSHNLAVGNSTSWAWLLFDYALATYLLINGTIVRVFVKWKGSYRNARKRVIH